MKIEVKNVEMVTPSDPFVKSIIDFYEKETRKESGVMYDILSQIGAVAEAKTVLSSIFEGTLLKITYALKDDVDLNRLIINICDLYCPKSKEHGKMKCTNFKIERRDGELVLRVVYKCMHPKCKVERFINEYVPKLWREAKTVLPRLQFVNVRPRNQADHLSSEPNP